ncbi:undecaprenyl-diphosphate phosphatase [Brevibacillus ginsengisoli]|uniref:undecaprenyl-diphosphate phosphatase n=1 Tax=Brevibacillus ginsengisoli TaxID=363854 RepID=UPI003CE97566
MHDYWIAVVQGIVEGLTEFLPVSSTGHLILAGELMKFEGPKAETFEIIIQLGAILAVVILYWNRIMSLLSFKKSSSSNLNLKHIIVAILPAMILGLLLHKVIKNYLFSPYTVLIGLVVGGLFMIYAEKRHVPVQTDTIDDLSYKQAFSIGLFQCLALWPGFSRSGATIAGGLLVGTNHKTAANFSFLIAIPMMIAASGYDLLKSYKLLSMDDLVFFLIGFFVSFIVALLAVVTFLKLLEKLKLSAFAYYRFIVAILFWLFILK